MSVRIPTGTAKQARDVLSRHSFYLDSPLLSRTIWTCKHCNALAFEIEGSPYAVTDEEALAFVGHLILVHRVVYIVEECLKP